jgi:hypothetical protein
MTDSRTNIRKALLSLLEKQPEVSALWQTRCFASNKKIPQCLITFLAFIIIETMIVEGGDVRTLHIRELLRLYLKIS